VAKPSKSVRAISQHNAAAATVEHAKKLAVQALFGVHETIAMFIATILPQERVVALIEVEVS
jgi:hypothetical protein